MDQTLETLQRWLQSVITHPGGVAAGLQSEAAQSQLAVAPDNIEQVVERSRRLTSVERLAVYANAYYARLAECLEADFPIFRQTVGDEAFEDFVFAYLQSHPSQSYTLAQLGANFAKFLDETKPVDEPDAGKPTDHRGDGARNPWASSWPDFLVDLAQLERTCSEVFDGPGVEGLVVARSPDRDAPPTEGLQIAAQETYGREIVRGRETRAQHVTADDLREIDPACWPEARLQLAPCLRLMEFRFPVNEYYTSMKQRGRESFSATHFDDRERDLENDSRPLPAIPEPKASWLALTRRDYIVRRYDLTRPQFMLLSALQRGEAVGEAILAAAEIVAGHKPTGCNPWASWAADLHEWFATWAAAPMFAKVILHG